MLPAQALQTARVLASEQGLDQAMICQHRERLLC